MSDEHPPNIARYINIVTFIELHAYNLSYIHITQRYTPKHTF